MSLLTVASKVTPTPELINQSFKPLYSVEGMLLCREADTRLAHCSHRGTFGGANLCTKLFVVRRVQNLGETQKDDELHQLQTWVLLFHVVLGSPGDRHVINTSGQTHFRGVSAAVGKL